MAVPKNKNARDYLSKSLEAEQEAVTDRFNKAESLLASKTAEASEPEPEAPPKQKKEKLVRQMSTMPSSDANLLDDIQTRCLRQGRLTNKSEIIRAGLHALAAMTDEELLQLLSTLPKTTLGKSKQET